MYIQVSANMADGDDSGELDWLSDYVLAFLKSPTWVTPIAQFVDERCIIFSTEEENKLEYTICHKDFKELIDSLMIAHLLDLSVTADQFQHFCQTGLARHAQLHRILVEQLLSVEDFLTFKAMMTKRNIDLYREAIKRLEMEEGVDANGQQIEPRPDESQEQPRHKLSSFDFNETQVYDEEDVGGQRTGKFVAEEWQLYEDQLFGVLNSSAALADPDFDDEEAELQRAIAMSLLAEEERIAQVAAAEAALRAANEAAAAQAQAQAPPVEAQAVAQSAPVLRAPLAPLRPVIPRVMRVEPLNSKAAQAAVDSLPPQIAPAPQPNPLDVERQRCEAILQRERTAKAVQAAAASSGAPQPAVSSAPGQPTEEERRQRTEHLKKQRELLVQKRNQERERQLAEFQTAQKQKASTPAGQSEAGKRLAAELAGAPQPAPAAPLPDTAAAAVEMRKALAQQLRQSLSRNMAPR